GLHGDVRAAGESELRPLIEGDGAAWGAGDRSASLNLLRRARNLLRHARGCYCRIISNRDRRPGRYRYRRLVGEGVSRVCWGRCITARELYIKHSKKKWRQNGNPTAYNVHGDEGILIISGKYQIEGAGCCEQCPDEGAYRSNVCRPAVIECPGGGCVERSRPEGRRKHPRGLRNSLLATRYPYQSYIHN